MADEDKIETEKDGNSGKTDKPKIENENNKDKKPRQTKPKKKTVKKEDTITDTKKDNTVKKEDTINDTKKDTTVKKEDTINDTKKDTTVKKEDTVTDTKEDNTEKKNDTIFTDKPKKTRKPSKRTKKTKIIKNKKNAITVRGKRKRAIARAVVKKGKGTFRINKMNINSFVDAYIREIMDEPLKLVPDIASNIDVAVTVKGGGPIGQAQAVRSAVARGIYEYTKDENLKTMFIKRDRYMFVEDSRRIEPKKYLGPKARARKQKSYR